MLAVQVWELILAVPEIDLHFAAVAAVVVVVVVLVAVVVVPVVAVAQVVVYHLFVHAVLRIANVQFDIEKIRER